MLKAISGSFLDFCLPRECPACRTGYESDTGFCRECEAELDKLASHPRCDRCAMPAAYPGAPCAQCQGGGLPPFKWIVSLGVHNDALKAAIHRMKYERRWLLAERLVDRMVDRDGPTAIPPGAVLVPVPLHRKRQVQRGYNQAEVMARRIKWRLGRTDLTVALPAIRIRSTSVQANLHARAQRVQNLAGAFVLTDPEKIRDRHLVLVDDVLTSGATLVSLARTLRPAKPASMAAIVLAVADPKGRQFEVI
jgi:ComF family protein